LDEADLVTVSVGKPQLPITPVRGGGGGDWVELLRARDDIEAHLLGGRLIEAGIEARTVKDRSAPGAWMYGGSNPWAPVTILVRRSSVDDARIVLAEISWAAPAYDQSQPPTAIEPDKKRTLMWWAVALILGSIFTSIGLMKAMDAPGGCNAPILCGGPSSTTP
jgi:hypothetical protein